MKKSRIQLFVVLCVILSFCMSSCTGADGKDGIAGANGLNGLDGAPGANGQDAVVNIDSLVTIIRNEISTSILDSLNAAPYTDTAYKALFDKAYYIAWMDSVRQSIIDSLKATTPDSLYAKIYDSVYSDIYGQSIIQNLYAEDAGLKDEIYGAYANQYPNMYDDYPLVLPSGDSIPMPFPIAIWNNCVSYSKSCDSRKVLVKSWISGFTDTATITSIVAPSDTIYLSPTFHFDNEKLYALSTSEQAIRQVEVYALENDAKILFYSESKPVTIHPMQLFGLERILGDSAFPYSVTGYKNANDWWIAAWVTPMSDSITALIGEIAKLLPNEKLLVYQKYYSNLSMTENMRIVVAAIFNVLQSRNIKYVQNTGTAILGQLVNYPAETLRKKQGICIETAVLFASILERLGFETSIILTSTHAFVGWLIEEENGEVIDLIETTMIGDANATFTDANNRGIEEYNQQMENGNFTTGESSIIPIDFMREIGIMPNSIP